MSFHVLSRRARRDLEKKLGRAVKRQHYADAWALLRDRPDQVLNSRTLTRLWLVLLDSDPEAEGDRDLLGQALLRWSDDPMLVYAVAAQLLRIVDGRHADEPVPDDDPARTVIPYLTRAIRDLGPRTKSKTGGFFWNNLGNAYRLAGPEHDEAAETAYREALATDNRPEWRFNLGLLYKNRCRWAEGVEFFQELFDEDPDEEPVIWNLGICATAHGDAELACKAWQAAGFPATVGADGRPSIERMGEVKVRIPGHPEDEPAVKCFEHVWVKPHSPCHGRVLNPCCYHGEVEIHDLVLWDGQPIGYARHGDVQVPRFVMLERLASGGWRSFRFRARQVEAGQTSTVTPLLPHECSVYVFEDETAFVCNECLCTGGPHTEAHEREPKEVTAVAGKVLLSPETPLRELRQALEEAVAEVGVPELAVFALYEALGDDVAAAAHRRKWAEL